MNSPRNDKALSHIYREGAWPEPDRQIKQAIRATERERRSFARRWALPFALAAAALLAFALIIRPDKEQPRPIAAPPPPASGSKVEQPPAAPDAQEGALRDEPKTAVKLEPQKAPVEPQRAPAPARAAAPPSPAVTSPPAMKRDDAERLRLLRPDVGLRLGSPTRESPPPAQKAALKKELPEREPTPDPPTFVPARPPQAWIEDIRKLKEEGRAEEAAFALAEFRKRNPDYVLPEDLR